MDISEQPVKNLPPAGSYRNPKYEINRIYVKEWHESLLTEHYMFLSAPKLQVYIG